MRLAICNETFHGWTWAATCEAAGAAGYDGVEIAPYTLATDVRSIDSDSRRAIAATAGNAGLSVAGLHWLLVSPPGLSLTARDAAVRAETAAFLGDLVDLCADLGGRVMTLGSPRQRSIPAGDTAETAVDRLVECLERPLIRAARRGVVVCLEPLPKPEADLILTLHQAADVLGRIRHPCLKTILDVKSASSEGIPIPELVHRYANMIAHVHANDAGRGAPGTGATDFRPILRALADVSYSGFVSVEVFDSPPDPAGMARRAAEHLRACGA